MASTDQNDPICMTGIRLHILTNGGSRPADAEPSGATRRAAVHRRDK
jgi:hypothetical protein